MYKKKRVKPNVSKAEIVEDYEVRHKRLPSFEWHGPLENYYRDGECYYKVAIIIAKCSDRTGESEMVYGHGLSSRNWALRNLTQRCNCGATWHEI